MNPDATTPPTLSTPTSGAASARVVIPIHPAPQRLHPRASQGRFTRLRWVFVLLTQAFFLGIPWLQIDGRQALLFYLEQQRFDVFGLVLWPQDLVYLTGLLVASALLLFLATALAGRVWCGFSCPQTVYTEIFLWIERRFEGDRTARLRLDRAPWHATKLLRRGGQHLAGLVFALWSLHRLFHADPRTRRVHSSRHGRPLGPVLDRLLHPGHLRQRRLAARAGLPAHVPVCAVPGLDDGPALAGRGLRRGAR